MTINSEPLSIIEFREKHFPKDKINQEDGEKLWRKFGTQISVDAPSFKNNYQWVIKSLGYVGFIPVSEEFNLSIQPKVPLKNLFGMWEYAYQLDKIIDKEDLYSAESISDFHSKLANILAKRVINRSRKGFYRAYLSRTQKMSYLKGRLELKNLINRPWDVNLRCTFDEITADVEENQILAWTLFTILRSKYCREEVLPNVRKAFRNIAQYISLQPVKAHDCVQRFYSRLNNDYEPMHALCRFFLENSGPSYEIGGHKMVPFIVKMDQLFEKFVAEWLAVNLPENYRIEKQETVNISSTHNIDFRIDLVLYNKATKSPVCVLDTKYKDDNKPTPGDIEQAAFYALIKDCNKAVLIYPTDLEQPMDEVVKGINIRSATFDLDDDLDQAGFKFFKDLMEIIAK
jgi:5-methylcytosine-specific restriction enzyme subunit McrC